MSVLLLFRRHYFDLGSGHFVDHVVPVRDSTAAPASQKVVIKKKGETEVVEVPSSEEAARFARVKERISALQQQIDTLKDEMKKEADERKHYLLLLKIIEARCQCIQEEEDALLLITLCD